MGIVGSETALSNQLKDVKVVAEGIRGSEVRMGNGSGNVTVGSGGSVCVDMDADEDGRMIGGFVWMEMEEVVDGIVWVVILTFEVLYDSQRSLSSCIPAS